MPTNNQPIDSVEWVSQAKRPNDTRLVVDEKVFTLLNIKPISWQENLDNVVDRYLLKDKK